MATVQEKTARPEGARKKVEAFAAKGGDWASKEGMPLGLEFVETFADVAKEFGYDVLKPMKKPVAFMRLVDASVTR